MKANESKLRRCSTALLRQSQAAWNRLRKLVRRQSVDAEVVANDLPKDQPDPVMNPLDRIEEYLLRHRLSPRVRVRFEIATGHFVLEDDDGAVHAKDYNEAVAMIKRTWF
jgi:hypothetical protein